MGVSMNNPESSGRSGFVLGLKDSLGIPVVGITSALVGYGVMAREAGLDVTLTLASVLTIWAMPVLMGFAELLAAGSSPLVVLITLLAVGFRNLPMAVSAMPMIRTKPGFRWSQILLAQLLSPTSWVQITVVGRQLQPANRMPYYVGFSLAILVFGLLGTWVGFALTESLPVAIGLSLLLLTPLFVTLTMATSPKLSSLLALVFGGVGVPLCMLWDDELGLILGGFLFGTIGYFAARKVERKARSGR